MTLEPGTTLGQYEIVSILGAGGMGEVYRAKDTKLGREVALKLLLREVAGDREGLSRFGREARVLASLNHPNIATLHGFEQEGDTHFLVMELVEGKTLADRIPAGGLAGPELARLALSLVDALGAAHKRGITHRDLKSNNIMVNEEERVKILDFGLAKLQHREQAGGDNQAPTEALTREESVVGTVAYMPPEQLQGREVDHRSDLFSVGVVLYEMATGRLPFERDSAVDQIAAILRDVPPPISDRRADLPRQLSRIVQRCLEKQPTRRYQSAADLLYDLEGLQDEMRTGSRQGSGAAAAEQELAAASQVRPEAADLEPTVAVMKPQVRYCRTTDGINIAYASLGEGPPLVRVLGWFTHLEVEWRWRAGREFQQRLARKHLLVRYDGRGMGLSQRGIKEFSLDTRLLDLEAVVDVAQLDRFALMGMSEGGSTAVAYAVRHPERVSHLILYGTWGQSPRKKEREQWNALIELIRTGWGQETPIYRRLFTNLFLGPNADADQIGYFDEMQRASASPATAAAYQTTCLDLDVRQELVKLAVPTLVVHRRGDLVVPFEAGVHLAQQIEGSRFLPMEGDNHWLFMRQSGMETYASAIEEFVGSGQD